MKLLKKSLALLLSLTLCLGLVTFSAFAEGPEDTDTPTSTEQNDTAQVSSETEEPGTDAVETVDGGVSSTPADDASQVVDSKSDDPSDRA